MKKPTKEPPKKGKDTKTKKPARELDVNELERIRGGRTGTKSVF